MVSVSLKPSFLVKLLTAFKSQKMYCGFLIRKKSLTRKFDGLRKKFIVAKAFKKQRLKVNMKILELMKKNKVKKSKPKLFIYVHNKDKVTIHITY